MVADKPPETPHGLPPQLEEQVLQAMELDPDDRRGAAIEALCAAHPGHAAAIHALVARLYSGEALTLGAMASDTPPGLPERIGPYRVLEVLGRGAFGTVFAAQEHDPDRKVAIKVLRLGGESPAEVREILARFAAERQAMALLNHPGIAKVFGSGTTGSGQPYFVMEFVDGLPIATYCEQHRLDLTARLLLFQQVCDAVHYAHHRGLIHRDLSVNNVLVESYEGRPRAKVIDFGLVKSLTFKLTDQTLHSRREQLMGTPEFMSPEQARSSGRDITPATDIYALGVMLYVLLTGTYPIPSARLREVPRDEMLHAIEEIEPEPPSVRVRTFGPGPGASKRGKHGTQAGEPEILAHARRLAGDLDHVTMKALRKARDERYTSAADLAAEIDRYLRNEPVLAGPPTSWYRVRKYMRRHRRPLLVAGAVTVALSIGLVAAGVQRSEAVAQAARAEKAASEALEAQRRATASEARLRVSADLLLGPDLVREAREDLWPALPEKLLELRQWVTRALNLQSREQLHRDRLVTTRTLLRDPGLSPDEREEKTWQLRREEALLDALRVLGDPDEHKASLASVRQRIAAAERAQTDLKTTYAKEWEAAIRTIADRKECPLYQGFELPAQMGLVPLGRNEATGLYEFWHPASGERPKWRDPAAEVGDETGMLFVLVPGGRFWMGAQKEGQNGDLGARDNEAPVRQVEIAPHFLSKYEMTQGQWLRFAGSNPSSYRPGVDPVGVAPTLRNPVEQVSWTDCRRALAQMGLRLPTEAEWEYACRAGWTTVYSTGNDLASLLGSANLADAGSADLLPSPGWEKEPGFDDGHALHAPVGSFKPNRWGLCDMHGNVWEFCEDAYLDEAGLRPAPGDGSGDRVIRGGSFRGRAAELRSAGRYQLPPGVPHNAVGVRPARSVIR